MTDSMTSLNHQSYDYQIAAIVGILGIIVLMITTEIVAQNDFYNPSPDDDETNNDDDNGSSISSSSNYNPSYSKSSIYLPMNIISLYGVYGIFVILLRMEWIKPLVAKKRFCCYNPSIDLFTNHNPYLIKQKVWCLFPCICFIIMILLGGIIHMIRSLFSFGSRGGDAASAGDEGTTITMEIVGYVFFLTLIMMPLMVLMMCVLSRDRHHDQQVGLTLEEKRLVSRKIYNKHIGYVFILITLHYVIITFDEHDMFNVKNFDFSVENIIFIISYTIVCGCLYIIKQYNPPPSPSTTTTLSSSDYQQHHDDADVERVAAAASSEEIIAEAEGTTGLATPPQEGGAATTAEAANSPLV